MDEHRKAVSVREVEFGGAAEERGLRRIVDHVVNGERTRKRGEVDRRGVGGAESGAGGVDDDGVGGEVGGWCIRRKTTQRNAVGGGRDGGEERVEIGGGAIGDGEGGATTLEAFDGGAARGAAGAEKNHVVAGEFDGQVVAQAGGETVAIGVVTEPAALGPEQAVDGADGARGGGDVDDVVDRDDLVRNGEVEAAETFRVKDGEGLGEIGGSHLEAEVAPWREARIVSGGGGQRGVVHRRADRVLDRLAEDGEGGAVEGPGLEVAEGKNAGILDFRFQIFD